MATNIRRIGVLTGGGDCPGLNAVIRAVTKSAIHRYGLEVFGIEDGFVGLIENHVRPLSWQDVSNILTLGGTILGTNNKCDPRQYRGPDGKLPPHDATARCLETVRQHQLDALIVIGGDGTMTVAAHLVRQGINCIGVPKTIDNDIYGTDITFGFASAVAVATDALDRIHTTPSLFVRPCRSRLVATDALDRIHTTAASHHRAMVVEVMGRNAGWIALHAGVASGADVILIPEIPFDIQRVCDFVLARSRAGKRFSILCVAEGARPKGGQQIVARVDPSSPEPVRLGGVGQFVADQIEKLTGVETRTTVLGHVQRGGSPVPADRVLATLFGSTALELLMSGARGRLVVLRNNRLSDIDLTEVEGKQRLVPPDEPLLQAARNVRTCLGD